MLVKVATVYRGESSRADNGSEIDLPIFGRFAARVTVSDLCVCPTDDGAEWYIRLPLGSTMGAYEDIESAVDSARRWLANDPQWTIDRERAKGRAIAEARARHEKKMAESGAYRAKYGACV